MTDAELMRAAIALAREGMEANLGGPFGAVVARGGEILGRGRNEVLATADPSAHAEINAIRAACRTLGTHVLAGCTLYTSCEPCPMCLGAIYWSRLAKVYFANTRFDAAAIGFDDEFFYRELALPPDGRSIPQLPLLRAEAQPTFQRWLQKPDRQSY